MKKLIMILPLALILSFIVGCQQGEEVTEGPALDVEAEREAIMAVCKDWAAVSESGDAEGYMNYLSKEVVLMFPGQPATSRGHLLGRLRPRAQ